ncbi:hypothetical protein CPB86DRAFT_779565 [Serendipita vermifera]|nr:hypothetical protein CPB86DRAFT_779565 [Serendipita vermifera]
MPKSTKKQKDKSADFKKAKLKLGKGKKPANNAVDTSFKAHSIALPTQSIGAEKSQAGPSTKRNHTLPELLSLLHHYSPSSRKDVLLGLRELLSAHQDLLNSSISQVISGCCKLISDEDASVRRALVDFLDWYLHRLQTHFILPHASVLMLFTTSAQTHIFPEIRVDAIKVLDLLLDVIPEVVVSQGSSGHGVRVLTGYLGLLVSTSSRSETDIVNTSVTILSAQSKLTVVSSLGRFLREASQQNENTENELWYLRSAFSSYNAYTSFINLFRGFQGQDFTVDTNEQTGNQNDPPIPFIWNNFQMMDCQPWGEDELVNAIEAVFSPKESLNSTKINDVMYIAEKSLHQFLVDMALEHGPSALLDLGSSAKDKLELRLVHAILKLARALYLPMLMVKHIHEVAVILHLSTLLMKLSAYIPVNLTTVPDDAEEISTTIQDINLIYCELYALVVLTDNRFNQPPQMQGEPNRKAHSPFLDHLSAVGIWVEETIRCKATVAQPMGTRLSQAHAKALAPTLWALLNYSTPTTKAKEMPLSTKVLQALIDQVEGSLLSLTTKSILIKFIVILILIQKESEYTGAFRIIERVPTGAVLVQSSASGVSKAGLIQRFLVQLPKILWEIGIRDTITSTEILSLLLRCAQRAALDWGQPVTHEISQRLTPFFSIKHPVRGPLYGPFRKFPSTDTSEIVQKLALHLAFFLCTFHGSRHRPDAISLLEESVQVAVAGTHLSAYWNQLKS